MISVGQTPCAILKIGLWNGAETDWRGTLLYKSLLQDAMCAGLRGGTVWNTVEGSRSSRVFRTVESEVSSNDLPVVLEFVEEGGHGGQDVLQRFIGSAKQRIGPKGIIVVEIGQTWRPQSRSGAEGRPATEQSVNIAEAKASGALDASSGVETDGVRVDSTGTGIRIRLGGEENSMEKGNRVNPENRERGPRMNGQPDAAYDGLQVQIFTLEQNQIDGRPVYQAVAEFLRQRGVLWISTARGITGFGEQRKIRQRSWWSRKNEVPIVVTVLDKVENLEGCLPELVEFVGSEGYIVSKPVVWHSPS